MLKQKLRAAATDLLAMGPSSCVASEKRERERETEGGCLETQPQPAKRDDDAFDVTRRLRTALCNSVNSV